MLNSVSNRSSVPECQRVTKCVHKTHKECYLLRNTNRYGTENVGNLSDTRRDNMRVVVEQKGGTTKVSRLLGYKNASFLGQQTVALALKDAADYGGMWSSCSNRKAPSPCEREGQLPRAEGGEKQGQFSGLLTVCQVL